MLEVLTHRMHAVGQHLTCMLQRKNAVQHNETHPNFADREAWQAIGLSTPLRGHSTRAVPGGYEQSVWLHGLGVRAGGSCSSSSMHMDICPTQQSNSSRKRYKMCTAILARSYTYVNN